MTAGASILFALVPAVSVLAARGLRGAPLDVTTAVGLACGALACAAQGRSTRPASGTPGRSGRGTGRAATDKTIWSEQRFGGEPDAAGFEAFHVVEVEELS
ncbi:hypothetical protein AB0H51_18560 [Streptomyces griseoluteus]|uniref:hypothetical protein n=1 Tax=Streptomyces griseoluteus TaxID=29306 RepID=UPI0033C3BFA1